MGLRYWDWLGMAPTLCSTWNTTRRGPLWFANVPRGTVEAYSVWAMRVSMRSAPPCPLGHADVPRGTLSGRGSVGLRLFHVEHLTALRALDMIPTMERRTGAPYSASMFHVEHCVLVPLLLCDVPRGTHSPLWSYLECSTWNSCAAVFLL